MEVQNHGVAFEDEVIYQITGMRKVEYQKLIEGAYTSSLDILKGFQSDIDGSVKTTGGNGIGCGDILRFMHHCKETEFTMIIGCWRQISPTHKRYNEIYEFYMNPIYYSKIWGGILEEHVKPFVEYVKSIPEGKQAQMANRKLWKEKRKEIYELWGRGLASIDAKIDSKTQRRVQCSVKLSELIEAGIPHTKYTSNYKGIQLPYEQESKPRTFS